MNFLLFYCDGGSSIVDKHKIMHICPTNEFKNKEQPSAHDLGWTKIGLSRYLP